MMSERHTGTTILSLSTWAKASSKTSDSAAFVLISVILPITSLANFSTDSPDPPGPNPVGPNPSP